ncbi:MAG: 1,4-dihydroxy-2-naphthoate octaprenyltransferase [Chlamydiae bacterium]|nr:1,4-dihydroxy-2-naphthoate octaprenyltransferase [Chlamydiota bacterium]
MNDFLEAKPWSSWLLAARPKTLTAALVPIVVATLLARADTGIVTWKISIYALLASFFIQIGTNLFNDALDYKKGADTSARLGPVRVTQSGLLTAEQVLTGGTVCFALAALFGIPLIFTGGWPLAVILILSVLSGYFYTGGPKPLAYSGLGDLFVIIFFGFVATVSVYYLQTGVVSFESFLAGAQIGLLITALLAMNNLRDIEGDAKSNKRTLPVRFGKTFGRVEISALILLPFALSSVWVQNRYLYAGILPWAAFPLGTMVIRGIWTHEPGRIYNTFFGMTALLHLVFGVLLSLGLSLR